MWRTSVVEVADDDAGKLQRAFSFGRDASGEVYVIGIGANDGGLHRIVPAD